MLWHTRPTWYIVHKIWNQKKQYSLKAGLKLFASCGQEAVTKELTLFHTLKCFKPMDPTKLSRDDHRNALTSLMFLTEKCLGEIKAHACANGSMQCTHVTKEEAAAQLSHQRLFSLRVQFLHTTPMTPPHVTYPVPSSKQTTLTMSLCTSMVSWLNLWSRWPHPFIINMSPPTLLVNLSFMPNWKRQYTVWWRVPFYSSGNLLQIYYHLDTE